MEATSSGAARGVSLSQLSSQSQKQWRVVSEHQVQNVRSEELNRSKLGQSDERTIYEVQQGQELNDVVNVSSIQRDGIVSIDDRVLQQKIHNLSMQRGEMQQVEIELRAQLIAKAKVVEMRNSFNTQFKEQANIVSRLQEQLREREQTRHELERKMKDTERELHALRLDNEAAWAKEDLLREQNEELANYRRERDSSEAERVHHKQQIHELQEHIQDKERQLLELQDQHKVAQETILYKDEQIRDAQSWMTRVQEMDGLQSSTLQAELRERTEQYNQLWHGCQLQFAEMERLHMHSIQQLQLELSSLRGNTATYNGDSNIPRSAANDGSQIAPNNGIHVEARRVGTPRGTSGGLAIVNVHNSQQYVTSGDSSSQANNNPSLPTTPSILETPSYLPPGQVTALHPYVMHQQGAGQAVGSHVPQSFLGHFYSVPANASSQQWQNHQAIPDGPTNSSQNQYSHPQAEESSSRSESNNNYELSVNGQTLHQDYLSNCVGQRVEPSSQISSSEVQTLLSVERSYFADSEAQHNLQQISSHFHEALRLEPLSQTNEMEAHEDDMRSNGSNVPVNQNEIREQPSSTASPSPSDLSAQAVSVTQPSLTCASDAVSAEKTNGFSSMKVLDPALLDERALLACIVRTIPPGGKIRVSSTLPNRLGKMLAPLHWHDYKKKYGKLDDFVACHSELFCIEGDHIQLREGAQGIIAATSAVAKAAAAAAASSPDSSFFPPVAVTPMAEVSRVKKIPSFESKPFRDVNTSSHHPTGMHSHYSNGSFNVSGNLSSVKILNKSGDPLEQNGQPGQSSLVCAENGAHVRPGTHFMGKQQGRAAAALASRR